MVMQCIMTVCRAAILSVLFMDELAAVIAWTVGEVPRPIAPEADERDAEVDICGVEDDGLGLELYKISSRALSERSERSAKG